MVLLFELDLQADRLIFTYFVLNDPVSFVRFNQLFFDLGEIIVS